MQASIHIFISMCLIIIVLSQEDKQGVAGELEYGSDNSFFKKNIKNQTFDGMVKKVTAIISAIFILSSISMTAFTKRTEMSNDEVIEESFGKNEENPEKTSEQNYENDGSVLDNQDSMPGSQNKKTVAEPE